MVFREKNGMVIVGIANILWKYLVLMETGWKNIKE
tara:strand:+ start:439 stop:543 length:105 start_codon:yes stop_codon:yes gene_type:complete